MISNSLYEVKNVFESKNTLTIKEKPAYLSHEKCPLSASWSSHLINVNYYKQRDPHASSIQIQVFPAPMPRSHVIDSSVDSKNKCSFSFWYLYRLNVNPALFPVTMLTPVRRSAAVAFARSTIDENNFARWGVQLVVNHLIKWKHPQDTEMFPLPAFWFFLC